MWVFPLGAAAVSAAFAISVGAQWWRRRRPNLLAWAVALAMFALASAAAALGVLGGWSPLWFRLYYLFGAIVNVPVLALGTIYLLGPRSLAQAAAVLVCVASLGAGIEVWQADLRAGALRTGGIPRGSEAVPAEVRALARLYSLSGFVVVAGGALWSAMRLSRSRDEHLRRLAVANALIAAGTTVVALGSAFAFRGRGLPFAIGLFAGVCLMFWGFLQTRPRAARPG